MWPTLEIEKSFHFCSSSNRRETKWNFTGCQMPHVMIVLIHMPILLNLSWIKKNVYCFRHMEPFRPLWWLSGIFHFCWDWKQITHVVKPVVSNTDSSFTEKDKRNVQWAQQPQAAALPRHQEENYTDKTKQAQIEQTYEKHKSSSLFPKRGNRNAKKTKEHKNKKHKATLKTNRLVE